MTFAITTALEFAWRNWKLILSGTALAILGVLLMLAKADARQWEKQALQSKARFDTEVLSHAVTRTSLNMLQSALDDQSRSVRALAAESDARALAAGDAKKAAQAAVEVAERSAKALDASAAAPRAGEPCAPSDFFWNSSRKDL
jgi:hypothetical protein